MNYLTFLLWTSSAFLALAPMVHADIQRFEQLSPMIYRGSRPETDADYQRIKALGVKTLLTLQILPNDVESEERAAKKFGFRLERAPILAWSFEPSENSVNQALEKLTDPKLQPIYVHCQLGRDRTGLVSALYRIYYPQDPGEEVWTADQAYEQELRKYGFEPTLTLKGISDYFWDHDDLSHRWLEP